MEEAFLSALHESPNDELTWSALADWLDDEGQAERAELVRLIRRLRNIPLMRRTRPRSVPEDRVAALLRAGVKPVVPEVVNSIGMRLALIPAGSFRMGSPSSEIGHDRDEQAHQVTLTRSFYLGVHQVTQGQFQAVMGSNPSHFSRGGAGVAIVQHMESTSDFPVETVSWQDTQAFIARLNALPGEGQLIYTLPTEAEWEYACRGGSASSGPFHFGFDLNGSHANFDTNHPYSPTSQRQPSLGRPCPVGSYTPNAFGLYDMHGNVWEWCQDGLLAYTDMPRSDPVGPGGDGRTIRGGAYTSRARIARAATRRTYGIEGVYRSLGFRIAARVREV